MARLTNQQKAFIVQRLACFDTPQEVAEAVQETFGITIGRGQIYNYDPTTAGYKQSPKWREIFDRTREAFVDETKEIGISHRPVRLRGLDQMYRKALSMKNYRLAADLMEQAAKEMGEAYSNKRKHEHSGPNEGPIQTESPLERIMGQVDQVAEREEGE